MMDTTILGIQKPSKMTPKVKQRKLLVKEYCEKRRQLNDTKRFQRQVADDLNILAMQLISDSYMTEEGVNLLFQKYEELQNLKSNPNSYSFQILEATESVLFRLMKDGGPFKLRYIPNSLTFEKKIRFETQQFVVEATGYFDIDCRETNFQKFREYENFWRDIRKNNTSLKIYQVKLV
jgi:hypothetical protein